MSELQLPPSSPVLDARDSDFDPFSRKKDDARGRHEYPTPNPSSTIGRSSSPARHENDVHDEAYGHFLGVSGPEQTKKVTFQDSTVTASSRSKAIVSINRDFNILNPDASVLRIPLLSGRLQLLVGRSSKSCDFHIKTVDRTVSRAHVRLTYDANSLTITCVGHNGLGMIVPRVCEVTRAADGAYELRETGKPLHAPNLSKTIHLDYQHTEFHVKRGESVRMPRFANVLLQISKQVLLVNPDDFDEEVTDDETSQAVPEPVKIIQDAAAVAPPTGPATPMPASADLLKTPQKPTKARSEKSTPIKMFTKKPQFKIFEDTETVRALPPKRAMTPLSIKSDNVPAALPVKRRAVSEEPSGIKRSKHNEKKAEEKKVERIPKVEVAEKTEDQSEVDTREPERDNQGRLIIDGTCIANMENRSEIENILINHLAFSRLSSTPASFLNTILAAVAKLSLKELRLVLHAVECIGVIYRLGKDAAGKPLEEEYYYIPEKDQDSERNKLVSLIKGHGGLRACRRTHKQYYWKRPAPIKK